MMRASACSIAARTSRSPSARPCHSGRTASGPDRSRRRRVSSRRSRRSPGRPDDQDGMCRQMARDALRRLGELRAGGRRERPGTLEGGADHRCDLCRSPAARRWSRSRRSRNRWVTLPAPAPGSCARCTSPQPPASPPHAAGPGLRCRPHQVGAPALGQQPAIRQPAAAAGSAEISRHARPSAGSLAGRDRRPLAPAGGVSSSPRPAPGSARATSRHRQRAGMRAAAHDVRGAIHDRAAQRLRPPPAPSSLRGNFGDLHAERVIGAARLRRVVVVGGPCAPLACSAAAASRAWPPGPRRARHRSVAAARGTPRGHLDRPA